MKLNVIYNEDCYEGIKKIPDKSIDLVYIDPPYLYQMGGKGKNQEGEYKSLFER
jgi:DNA modification methylase